MFKLPLTIQQLLTTERSRFLYTHAIESERSDFIDLERQSTEGYHGPEAGEYRHVDHYGTEMVSPQEFPDLKVDLEKLIPD